MYHIPFAPGIQARRLISPERTNDLYWQGFPHLPQFVQGQFWRLTGNVNGVGLSTTALCDLSGYCHCALKARFWWVALIALTTLGLIHTASGCRSFREFVPRHRGRHPRYAHINDDYHRIGLMTWG